MNDVRKAWVILAVGVATALGSAGCADEEPAEPPTISGTPAHIAQVVSRLEHATATGDFATICSRLLTPSARRRAGGAKCAAEMKRSAGRVDGARIRIVSIAIRGKQGRRASVVVRTSAKGEPDGQDVLELQKRGGRYRINALAG